MLSEVQRVLRKTAKELSESDGPKTNLWAVQDEHATTIRVQERKEKERSYDAFFSFFKRRAKPTSD